MTSPSTLVPSGSSVWGMNIADVQALLVPEGDCLVWPRAKFRTGYGAVRIDGRTRTVHRALWEYVNRPLAPWEHLDHLCSNRSCANLEHLSVVTISENNKRTRQRGRHGNANTVKAACPRCGGPFTTYTRQGKTERVCRPCRAAYLRRWRAARRLKEDG